jgi:hypothetical protein
MKCPCCGAAELVHDTRTPDAGEVPVVVSGGFCPVCGECVIDRENGDRHAAAQRLVEQGGKAPEMAEIPRRK